MLFPTSSCLRVPFDFGVISHAVLAFILVIVIGPAAYAASTVRIEAGSPAADYTDHLGRLWVRDTYFTGGGQVSAPSVSGTLDPHLYRIARSSPYTDFHYTIPVDNGSYTVTLKFAETTYTAPGQRVFHVRINGQMVLANFDIMAEVPTRTALDKTFNVTATAGTIQIDFLRGNRFGIVSAIEILPAGPPPVDLTPPVLSAGAPSGSLPSGTTQANLSLTTNENASCRYSTNPGQDFVQMPNAFATTGAKQHSTPVAGLQDDEAYSFYVRCQDGQGNANTSDFLISFSVNAPPPPAITIASPAAGAVSGTVTVLASVQGPDIVGVSFFLDGQPLGVEDLSSPYSMEWNTTLVADDTYALTARLRYGSPEATLNSAAVNVNVGNSGPPPGLSTVRIHAGSTGADYTDSQGNFWMRDTYYFQGGQVSAPSVSGTPDSQLYRIARSSLYSDFSYHIPVDDGRYAVTLKFAETTQTAAGQRIFNVKINGEMVLQNFDIMAEVPQRYALDKTFTVDVSGGYVDIEFVHGNKYGIVSAIEILPAGPDTTVPLRSAGQPSGSLPPGTSSTLMSLSTDENAVCRHAQTAGTAWADMTGVFTTTGAKQHQTTLSGLTDGQTYTKYVRCKDTANNANLTDFIIQFSVQTPPPPSISITSPLGGVRSGVVTIQAAGAGPSVQGVTFFVDDNQLGAEDTAAPFQRQWDTTAVNDGPHALSARLRYGSPQSTLDSAVVNVMVDNTVPAGTSEIRINSGRSVNYTDANGKVWSPDQYYTGGQSFNTNDAIQGTNEQDLYRYVRDGMHNGEIWYEVPVTNGLYILTLKFAEIEDLQPTDRIVDVVVNGRRILRNLDLPEFVGTKRAFDVTVKTEVKDGLMRIFLAQVVTGRRPTISALAIEPVTGTQRTDLSPPVRSLSGPDGPLPVGTTQTTLQLNTNENAVCRYSTTEDNPFSSILGVFTTTGGTVHSTNISGLVAGRAYIYRVRCRDGALNDNQDDLLMMFSVPEAGSPPAVAVSAPGNGAGVSGAFMVQAQLTGTAPTSVQFYLNGIPLGPRLTQAPYQFEWNTLFYFNGSYRLTAWARYGGTKSSLASPIEVTVENDGLAQPGTSTVRLHSGSPGSSFTDPGSGNVWDNDAYYQGGSTMSVSRVYRTPLPHLYRVTRQTTNSSFTYNIPLANGRYKVRLLFSELAHTLPGTRLFDVKLNGVKALSRFDILEEAPWKEPVEKSFQATVTNGSLLIEFDHVLRGAIVSAIEVTPAP